MYSFESNLVSNETILSELMGTVQYVLTENSLFSAFYSRGGIWCFAPLFLSAVLFLRRQKDYLFLFLPRLDYMSSEPEI